MEVRHSIEVNDRGIFHVHLYGVWSIAQVDAFFDELIPMLPAVRQRFGRIYGLIKVHAVQSPGVALHFRNRAVGIKQGTDRNAVIVNTVLSKLQIMRLASTSNFGLFADVAKAEEWLLRP